MANCNFNKCLEALKIMGMNPETLNMTVKTRYKKNGKRLGEQITDINGLSTSDIYGLDGWLAFFNDNIQKSMASAKVEEGHTHARCQENTTDEITRIQNQQDQHATYVKKYAYPFQNLSYPQMMNMVFDDYAVAWDAYDIELKNDNILIKHGRVISKSTLEQFSKLWLSENQMYDKYKNNIDYAIRKWWLVA